MSQLPLSAIPSSEGDGLVLYAQLSIMTRMASVRRARRQRTESMVGFVVTWDVHSRDHASCSRLRRLIFGYSLRNDGRSYRYPGFVEKEGVRYLGQSVLFVARTRLDELRAFLRSHGVPHAITEATLGAHMLS